MPKMSDANTKAALESAIVETGERLLPYFRFVHLPSTLQATSEAFAELAVRIVRGVPSNPERTVALRKLLEAKDCAVRAML
jgi:hypothetical protein